jgi:hypothetical protein
MNYDENSIFQVQIIDKKTEKIITETTMSNDDEILNCRCCYCDKMFNQHEHRTILVHDEDILKYQFCSEECLIKCNKEEPDELLEKYITGAVEEVIITMIENGQKLKLFWIKTDYGYYIKKVEFI